MMATATTTNACWSCREMTATHFCETCGKVQPAAPLDYFGFFGLPRKLNIDTKWLEKEFYRLSRKLHPDVYARASRQEQEWSLEKTSRLNDAYRSLKDPVERTKYLLNLEGIQLEEQSKSATDTARATGTEKKQVVPPDLLEEVFELNMQLEELRASAKIGATDSETVVAIKKTQADLEQKLAANDAELVERFNEWDAVENQPENSQRAAVRQQLVDVLNRRSYIRNLVRDVKEALTTV
jgi:molecular chaperone HscB